MPLQQVRNSSLGCLLELLEAAGCAVVSGFCANQLCRSLILALRSYGDTLRMSFKAERACRKLWAEGVDRLLREHPDGLPYEPASGKGRIPGPVTSLRGAVRYHQYSAAACRLCSDVACKVMPRVLLSPASVRASALDHICMQDAPLYKLCVAIYLSSSIWGDDI